MTDLAVIIVNFNTKALLLKALASVYQQKVSFDLKVIVVDNASSDDSVKATKKEFPQVELIESPRNVGFAAGNNLALAKVKAGHFLLLNSDTIVLPDCLELLMTVAKTDQYALLSCKLLNEDHSLQPNAGFLPTPGPLFLWLSGIDDLLGLLGISSASYHLQKPAFYRGTHEVGWVAGTALLISSEVLSKIGALDGSIFMYAEDVEYCWRAREAGFKVGFTDQAQIIHLGGGSSPAPKLNQWKGEFKGLLYLYSKFYGKLAGDILRVLMYIFIALRMIVFFLLGKKEFSKTYAQVIRYI
ncbi:hypothetical protein A2631_02715 [Candidatus Daviesbacteria bacterium RIFCSPHIGHO2_01_FULL_44_29]|uniref:Glycosyltransferase 2-like domain-containing protein n=1 Tax=Candidatus Daviesbacteria bacterium RIFCSPHIGHO2_02_FULL_43_12 TaxID=1797776 RepID=A0A1F5KK31_9BACT|nr:MAG: hypothetical protein A2631_02715 [Candidatus Daviesbacteria bacterium RIFCSPHIGHO2_01_FULL_44_29]OGE40847.1 MAG: hypothetical protein A3E86_02635 [Candidatus Daviesbacteria bacterium RIFCSPHIGHO2_12_FULL_47_45]OGE41297.1 MAG: hypothetical protein A3D25_02110 [Candidatus Daviesbacteria bacterium RIFCSPHIGHO2_02_FULL_43_12]OGE69498.1 MAG: hypothetical protein A3B55_03850 [Candidatus Daviesbacteria bacterium RIFCSPLOWO2_01_FULL_43_15]